MRLTFRPLLALTLIALAFQVQAAIPDTFGEPASTAVSVYFPDKSAVFRPDSESAELLAEARRAALVYVSGRTSTDRPTAADERLALRRALAARSYLVSRGVNPLKVMINFASGTDFVSDNSTHDSRRENQRVDIEMIHVPPDCCVPPNSYELASRQERQQDRSAFRGRFQGTRQEVQRDEDRATPQGVTTEGFGPSGGLNRSPTQATNCSARAVGQPTAKASAVTECQVSFLRPMPQVAKAERWIANGGSTLRAELLRWAERAGWRVVYDTTTDYQLIHDVPLPGRFDEAVAALVQLYEVADQPLIADIHIPQRLIYITNKPSN